MMAPGFYKFQDGEFRYGPESIYAPGFTLLIAEHESYIYPMDGWYYFASRAEAEAFFEINGRSQGDWPAFFAATLGSPEFSAAQIGAEQILAAQLPTATGLQLERLLRAKTALQSLPAVLLAAGSSLGGVDLFIGAWLALRQAHLVSPEVAVAMTQLATACNLPDRLIRSLGAPQQ